MGDIGVIVISLSEGDPCQCSPWWRRCQGPPHAEGTFEGMRSFPQNMSVGLRWEEWHWLVQAGLEMVLPTWRFGVTPSSLRGAPKGAEMQHVGLRRGE